MPLKDLIYSIWRKISSASVGHNVTPASVDDNRALIDDYMASTVNKRASFNDDRLMDKVPDSSVGGNQERKIHCCYFDMSNGDIDNDDVIDAKSPVRKSKRDKKKKKK